MLSSAALHVLVIALALAPALFRTPPAPTREHWSRPVAVFASAPATLRPAPALIQAPSSVQPLGVDAAAGAASPTEVKVDMGRMQLRFARDVANELPRVVAEFGVSFALLDREEPQAVARYMVSPPLWELRPVMQDVSGYWGLRMDDPER